MYSSHDPTCSSPRLRDEAKMKPLPPFGSVSLVITGATCHTRAISESRPLVFPTPGTTPATCLAPRAGQQHQMKRIRPHHHIPERQERQRLTKMIIGCPKSKSCPPLDTTFQHFSLSSAKSKRFTTQYCSEVDSC